MQARVRTHVHTHTYTHTRTHVHTHTPHKGKSKRYLQNLIHTHTPQRKVKEKSAGTAQIKQAGDELDSQFFTIQSPPASQAGEAASPEGHPLWWGGGHRQMAQIEISPLPAIFLPNASSFAHCITQASSDSCRGGGGDSHFLAPQSPNPPPPYPKANRTIIYRQKKKMLRGRGPGEARERVQGKMPPLDPEHKLS